MRPVSVPSTVEAPVRHPRRLIVSTMVVIAAGTSYVATAAQATTSGTAQVLVKFQPNASVSDMSAATRGVGANDIGTIRDLGVHVLSVPGNAVDSVVAALSHRADVD